MIICADDYGLSRANNAAIIELARARRISAVSVMITVAGEQSTDTSDDAALLAATGKSLDIGLHLTLTAEGRPVSESTPRLTTRAGAFHGLNELIRRAYMGRLRASEVRTEIIAQIGLFQARFGQPPDYIDGHLHVQQLPVIRGAVAQIAAATRIERPFYVRNAWEPYRELASRRITPAKHALIAWPGRRLCAILRRHAVPTNQGFAGVYDYRRWKSYPDYLKVMLPALRHTNAILMTHPGHDQDWRRMEFETLLRIDDIKPNRFQHV